MDIISDEWIEYELGRPQRWHGLLACFGQGYFLITLLIGAGLSTRLLWALSGWDWRGTIVCGFLLGLLYLLNKRLLDGLTNLIFCARHRMKVMLDRDFLAVENRDGIEHFLWTDMEAIAVPVRGHCLWIHQSGRWFQLPLRHVPPQQLDWLPRPD